MMLSHPTFAHFLLLGGAALAVIGLILWGILPIASTLPPFLFSALLALGYGAYELRRERSRKKGGSDRP